MALFTASASAQKVEGHPDNCWWCAREEFNLSDDALVWKYLTAPVYVLDKGKDEKVYLLDQPDGQRVSSKQYEGFVYGASVSVHVLDTMGSWTKIEAYDMSNYLIEGWVRSSLIKTQEAYQKYGIVVDKQTQRLHLYEDGKKHSTLLCSTGLPEAKKPFNETAAGEYFIISWSGGFWSGNMYCDLGLQFNGGDLVHLVPALVNADGSYNHSPFEPLLGQKASHGCIRVQRVKSEEGINMLWLWDNLKRYTKIIVWDDSDRPMFYPDYSTALYYNPNGGSYYHTNRNCPSIKERFLPLQGEMTYFDLMNNIAFSKLTACSTCAASVIHPSIIDEYNEERGFTREQAEEAQALVESGESYIPSNDDEEETTEVTDAVETVHSTDFEDLG
ncbi:MAG: L,D-transpeptidase [Oscillospiraceae bacterium]|nr:L,D-transpeptidase [Oscillospiraceae bacterium]